jgi:multiple sugar transport system ATP-binding protein
MGDKVAVMNEGILQQIGTANEIYFHPANVFVAGFIGTPPTNFFSVTLTKRKPYLFEATSFQYPVPETLTEKAETWSSELILGIRPQDVIVQSKSPERKAIKATLEIDEPLGDRQVLDLKIGDYLVKALVSPDFKADLGDELWIEFPSDKIYVFDGKSGKALT